MRNCNVVPTLALDGDIGAVLVADIALNRIFFFYDPTVGDDCLPFCDTTAEGLSRFLWPLHCQCLVSNDRDIVDPILLLIRSSN